MKRFLPSLSGLLPVLLSAAVCSLAIANPPRFVVVSQADTNLIEDQMTHLMWERTVSTSSRPTWGQALAHCEALDLAGYQDWRLPHVLELSTLVDDNQFSPAINATFFPAFESTCYWTSTTTPSNTSTHSYAMVVRFGGTAPPAEEASGAVNSERKSNRCQALCVRDLYAPP